MFSINKTSNMLPLFFTSSDSAATCLKTHTVPVERSQLCFLVRPALPGPVNKTWSSEGMKRRTDTVQKSWARQAMCSLREQQQTHHNLKPHHVHYRGLGEKKALPNSSRSKTLIFDMALSNNTFPKTSFVPRCLLDSPQEFAPKFAHK